MSTARRRKLSELFPRHKESQQVPTASTPTRTNVAQETGVHKAWAELAEQMRASFLEMAKTNLDVDTCDSAERMMFKMTGDLNPRFHKVFSEITMLRRNKEQKKTSFGQENSNGIQPIDDGYESPIY